MFMRIHSTSQFNFNSLGGLLVAFSLLVVLSGCPFAGPTAAFTASPTEGDAPLTVDFIDQSINGGADITQWLWDFGDGSQSVEQNPAHIYTSNGFYRISLRVSNNNGTSTETKEDYISVRAVPNAAFSATPRTGNTPLTVQFQDESTAAPFEVTAWRWTFGDGEISTEQSPAHIYEQPGAYNVSLTVTSDGGTDKESQDGYIVVSELSVVTFDAAPTLGAAPLEVQFTDTSSPGSDPIDSWFWLFGDGGTSDEQNPTYHYDTPGIYSVSLTTRTIAGEITGMMNNLITVTQAPVAAFSATPTSGAAPLGVNFVDESVAGTSPITDWLWDFGDGTSSIQRNPVHEFTEAGVYDIELTVTTEAGTGTFIRSEYIAAQAPPVAAFNASTLRGTVPLTVEFTDASAAGTLPISGRQWNFGDTTTSGDVNPVHVYTQPGIYTVSLLVQSAVASDIQVEQAYIEVVSTPDANFTAAITAGESPLTVVFSDTSVPGTRPITAWLWDFGDGTTSDIQNPTRIYTDVRPYTVKLTVTTEEGTDTETRIDYVRVQERPVADFSADTTAGAAPLTVQFRDASTSGTETITSRTWDFGDGSTSAAEDPLHTYTTPGIYTVTLNLETTSGPESESKSAFITVDPAVSFTAAPDTDRAPTFVSFTDTTNTGALTVSARLWDFGDGETSDQLNPIHQYTAPGTYDVSLTITTAQGDAALLKTEAVNLRPTPLFSGEPLSGTGGPFSVQFMDETDPGTLTINGWDWNFGDGGHSDEQNPAHTFSKPGLYAVSLTVLTDIGNSETIRGNYISIRPEAAFSADVTMGVDSLLVNFTDETDTGNLSLLSWQWTFGDGGSSTVQSPTHTYAAPRHLHRDPEHQQQ
jgi:PKD repeat protein